MKHFISFLIFTCMGVSACKSERPAPEVAKVEPPPVVARLQAGRFKVGSNDTRDNVVTKAVTFSEPFPRSPIVVVTPVHFSGHPDVVSVTVVNTTPSGFSVLIHRTDQPVGGWGLELNLDWIAVDYGGGTAKLLGGA